MTRWSGAGPITWRASPSPTEASLVPEDLFLGDVVIRTWDAGFWALRSTARSGDVRKVSARENGQGWVVEYPATPKGVAGSGTLA